MTRIQSNDTTSRHALWEQFISPKIGDYHDLAKRSWADISSIEFLPNIFVDSPVYEVPERWLPHGFVRRLNFRTVDPFIGTEWNESIRRSLFALSLPRRTARGTRSLKPTSWLYYSKRALRMARWSVGNRPSADGRLWSHLNISDWREMLASVSTSMKVRRTFVSIIRMLEDLGRRNVLSDYPILSSSSNIFDPEPELAPLERIENTRRGQVLTARSETKETQSFQPLPDVFVASIIERARWLYDNLADQLIDCWSALRQVSDQDLSVDRKRSNRSIASERRKILDRTVWRDKSGNKLVKLPWQIVLRESNKSIFTDAWPPRDQVGITMMITTIQALNFCCVALCTGARSSEILSATDSSMCGGDGRLHAKTFKLVDEFEGAKRDWPLHPVAVRALKLQQRIADEIRSDGDSHIWVTLKTGLDTTGTPLRSVSNSLVNSAEMLGLDNTGGARPHAHRWRTTVARLVALSVASAPQVLMDIFGHRDLEMTLRYMLAHPQMAEEVMRIASEMNYAMASEAITDAEAGYIGGPAATGLLTGLREFKARRGEDSLDATSMREAIEILTFNERDWQLIRPGILCTKTLGQFGPCTMGRGDPDPGACRTTCEHRLETARAKADCEGALDYLLNEHELASRDDEEMTVASLEGQILANLFRWNDVRERLVESNVTAKKIWDARVNA